MRCMFGEVFLVCSNQLFLNFLYLRKILGVKPFVNNSRHSSYYHVSLEIINESRFESFYISVALLYIVN